MSGICVGNRGKTNNSKSIKKLLFKEKYHSSQILSKYFSGGRGSAGREGCVSVEGGSIRGTCTEIRSKYVHEEISFLSFMNDSKSKSELLMLYEILRRLET